MTTNEKWFDRLTDAVRENPALLRDARRCGAMLRDLLPGDGNRAKVNALRMALEEAIPKLLEDDHAGGERSEHSVARRTKNFVRCDRTGRRDRRMVGAGVGYGDRNGGAEHGRRALVDQRPAPSGGVH